jgi:hypothetical protein
MQGSLVRDPDTTHDYGAFLSARLIDDRAQRIGVNQEAPARLELDLAAVVRPDGNNGGNGSYRVTTDLSEKPHLYSHIEHRPTIVPVLAKVQKGVQSFGWWRLHRLGSRWRSGLG